MHTWPSSTSPLWALQVRQKTSRSAGAVTSAAATLSACVGQADTAGSSMLCISGRVLGTSHVLRGCEDRQQTCLLCQILYLLLLLQATPMLAQSSGPLRLVLTARTTQEATQPSLVASHSCHHQPPWHLLEPRCQRVLSFQCTTAPQWRSRACSISHGLTRGCLSTQMAA